MDLTRFEAAYRTDGRGRPPFAPRMMLALILYGRSKGLISNRALAAACHDDLGARLITGNRYPDHTTINRFLATHEQAIAALLPQTLALADADGLLDVSVVAGDGSKLCANAAMSATVDEATLRGQIDALQQQLADAEKAWSELVAAEPPAPLSQPSLFNDLPEQPTNSHHSDKAWRRVRTLATTLHRRQAALNWLQAHPNSADQTWAARAERDQQRLVQATHRLDQTRASVAAVHQRRQQAAEHGAKLPGSKPATIDDDSRVRRAQHALNQATTRLATTLTHQPASTKVNTTDPTSAIMPGKHDGYDQRHNIQALATTRQLILAIGTHLNSNDKQALTPLLHQARTNLDAAAITTPIGTALFDSGYASDANFTTTHPVTELLIAVTGPHQPTTIPTTWQPMADKLANPDNQRLYRQRAAIIEPIFAQLFTRFGRAITQHGPAVTTELHLWAITHNLLKISRHQPPRPAT